MNHWRSPVLIRPADNHRRLSAADCHGKVSHSSTLPCPAMLPINILTLISRPDKSRSACLFTVPQAFVLSVLKSLAGSSPYEGEYSLVCHRTVQIYQRTVENRFPES